MPYWLTQPCRVKYLSNIITATHVQLTKLVIILTESINYICQKTNFNKKTYKIPNIAKWKLYYMALAKLILIYYAQDMLCQKYLLTLNIVERHQSLTT